MREFLKYTFASLIGNLLAAMLVLGLGTGGLIFLVVAAAGSKDTGPQVKDKSVLVFDLGLNINDTNPESTTSEAVSQVLSGEDSNTITLRSVLDTIEKATTDDRIVGLYLDGSAGGAETGLANLREVRSALEKFRESGKPIFAYDVNWGEREYYLGSVADRVFLNPLGAMEFNGLSAEIMFLAGAFQKYGIGIQVIRVGKYKSAVEPFIQTKLSPESREQMQKLLNDLWGEFLTTVGRHRDLNSTQLQAIADSQGILKPQSAQSKGLVDKLAYFDEVVQELKQLTGNDEEDKTFNQIDLTTYARVAASGAESRSKNQIALVYAEGTIVDGQGGVREIGGDRFSALMRKLREDDQIKAVVLRVNSPGGSATASEVIGREVELTSHRKPVIVSMGDYAASGGYWISAYGDRIFAEPNTITGSIGVYGILSNIQELAADNGITWDVVKTGRYADMQTIARPKTDAELQLYQNSVNRIYQLFLNKVAEGRNLSQQKVAEIAQGRVWSGLAAKNIDLVDEIGGLEAAIAFAAKKAELGENWRLQEYPKTRTLEQRIIRKLVGANVDAAPPDLLIREFQKLQAELAILTTLNDPLGVYARLPFHLLID
ncbi:MAG: signal peptide peptidase SppA [Hormoscilla sp. GM7CHS1pb]|nr:signal peptide peptidase SppA [Hormoscilla sp. GM7CHS1pb]